MTPKGSLTFVFGVLAVVWWSTGLVVSEVQAKGQVSQSLVLDVSTIVLNKFIDLEPMFVYYEKVNSERGDISWQEAKALFARFTRRRMAKIATR